MARRGSRPWALTVTASSHESPAWANASATEERPGKTHRFSLQNNGTVAVNTEHLQVPPATSDERRVSEQTFDLLVERSSIETNDGYAAPAHAGPHVVSSRAPGLAPAGSRVSKSTRMT